MRLLIICLLLSSCAYAPKTYTVTQKYRVLGVKCPSTYYFNYETQSCVVERHYINAEDNPSGVSIDVQRSFKSSPEALKAPLDNYSSKERAKIKELTKNHLNSVNKQKQNNVKKAVDCRFILSNINKCMH